MVSFITASRKLTHPTGAGAMGAVAVAATSGATRISLGWGEGFESVPSYVCPSPGADADPNCWGPTPSKSLLLECFRGGGQSGTGDSVAQQT